MCSGELREVRTLSDQLEQDMLEFMDVVQGQQCTRVNRTRWVHFPISWKKIFPDLLDVAPGQQCAWESHKVCTFSDHLEVGSC